MANRNLEVSEGDSALILHGLLELSAKLDRAQDVAARTGDIAGLMAIDASRGALPSQSSVQAAA